ncbi:MAG TPA: hypothetical protein VMH38_07500 [Thermoplasmata archaeon]|nr:hypothetical protein [Thermoplasmata archaeon]
MSGVTANQYRLRARVSTADPTVVGPVLERAIAAGTVSPGDSPGEFRVEATLQGASARELNRALLSELRRVEKKTRLRSEWTCNGVTERFFDYVPKGTRKA